jgi:crotonobetainyl-CoA:carnitine CoA-transferase CaiB-like acyl-CoA transferase
LAGIRVLDLSRLLPGAFCSLLLSDLGAEVTKVEHPDGGDGLRSAEPFLATGESAVHVVLDRGKRSVTLDLKTDAGLATARAMAIDCDVVVESFRPGTLSRLGLGWSWLTENAPRVVLASLSAFGQSGPDAQRSGHDLNALAEAGTLSLSAVPRPPDGQPADVLTGALAAVGIMAALRERERTGRGRHVDAALVDAAAAVSVLAAAQQVGGGAISVGRMLGGSLACYSTYRCADDRWVAVGALEPGLFATLCRALDRDDLAPAQFDPMRQAEVRDALAQRFASRTRQEWLRALADVDAAVSPVLDLAEAAAAASAAGRRTVAGHLLDGSPVRLPGDFVRLDGPSCAPTDAAPRLGAPTVGPAT